MLHTADIATDVVNGCAPLVKRKTLQTNLLVTELIFLSNLLLSSGNSRSCGSLPLPDWLVRSSDVTASLETSGKMRLSRAEMTGLNEVITEQCMCMRQFNM